MCSTFSNGQNAQPQQITNQTWNLGMSSAVSMEVPKLRDLQKTRDLAEALVSLDVSESNEELNHRQAFHF